MAQNHQVAINIQGLPNQYPNGAIMGDINIHEPIEVQATERHMDEPGNNIDDQILPYFMAVIPDEVKAGYDNTPLSVEATGIDYRQQVDEGIQRALLDVMHIPNNLPVGGQ